MKSKYHFFIVAFLLVGLCSNAQFVKKHGQLSVKGTQLVDKNQNPIVLRGVSFGWHSMWPRFYNAKAVDWLKKDFNCTVVRAALGIEIGEYPYLKATEFSKEKLEAVVKGAIKSDIYVFNIPKIPHKCKFLPLLYIRTLPVYTIYRKENRKREFMYAIKRFANREKS